MPSTMLYLVAPPMPPLSRGERRGGEGERRGGRGRGREGEGGEKGHFGLGMAFLVALAGPLAATSLWGLARSACTNICMLCLRLV
jgi:hypothetical protein